MIGVIGYAELGCTFFDREIGVVEPVRYRILLELFVILFSHDNTSNDILFL